jgi:hypothetical protein
MDGLLRKFVFGNPEVTAIWMLLILLAVVALYWLVGPGFRQRTRDARRLQEASFLRRERLAHQASDDSRYASEIAVAAQRARERELSLRDRWLAMQQQTESAWKAYDAAETQLLRLAPAGAIPLTAEPDDVCEHELKRATIAACLRGDLSPLDLTEALRHTGAWDPHRHPADQEIAVRRQVRRERHSAWRLVAEREQSAWQAYATAATQARSLSDEAFVALRRSEQTDELLSVAIADRRRRAAHGQDRRRHGLIQA